MGDRLDVVEGNVLYSQDWWLAWKRLTHMLEQFVIDGKSKVSIVSVSF